MRLSSSCSRVAPLGGVFEPSGPPLAFAFGASAPPSRQALHHFCSGDLDAVPNSAMASTTAMPWSTTALAAATFGFSAYLLGVAPMSSSHDDYSRIVLEFEGEGTPGWNAPQWDVDASTMGKGDPITVKGDHTLVIHGTGTASAPSSGQQQAGQQRLDLDKGDNDEGIEEAFVDPGFEGEFQVVLGTDSQTYRIFTLSDPTRLVIDVADDDQEHSDDQDRDDLGGSGQDQEEHGDEG